MNKAIYTITITILLCALSLTGCAKKKVAKKGPGGNFSTTPIEDVGNGEGLDSVQLDAMQGSDIPLSEVSANANFVEASDPAFENVYFAYDSSALTDEGTQILNKIASWMQSNTNTQVMIEGHADERGTHEYNLALGEERALSVRRFLVSLGITEDRLHTISYGEERPLVQGAEEQSYAQNRRAHFLVSAE